MTGVQTCALPIYLSGPPLHEAAEALRRVIEYRGTWSVRINVQPFAELLLQDDRGVLAREFTPAGFKRLDLGAGDITLQLFWPSIKDPRLKWSGHLAGLLPGQTVVISGDLKNSKIVIDRK